MVECSSKCPVANVEFVIKLLVGQVHAQEQQLARRPGVVREKPIKQVHTDALIRSKTRG